MATINNALQLERGGRQDNGLRVTNLFELMQQITETVGPGNEDKVIEVVMHLFASGRIRFVRRHTAPVGLHR